MAFQAVDVPKFFGAALTKIRHFPSMYAKMDSERTKLTKLFRTKFAAKRLLFGVNL